MDLPAPSSLVETIEEIDFQGDIVKEHWLDKYIYAACSGVIGSMSLLFAGCTSKMLGRLFQGHYSEYSHPMPYIIIGALVCCLVLQTHLLNVAMQKGGTMSIYPVFQVRV